MSDLTKHWAWRQQLPPTQKLLLLVLSDESDDQGCCGTSTIAHFANKCCMSERTVFRLLQILESYGLIERQQRFEDGRQLPSEFLLKLDAYVTDDLVEDQLAKRRPAKLSSPLMIKGDNLAGRAKSSPSALTPRPDNLAGETTKGVVVLNTTTTPDDGLREPLSSSLVPPCSLSLEERAQALQMVAGQPFTFAQQLLDEIEGSIQLGKIKGSWPGLLCSLISNGLTPNRGLAVARERKRREVADRQAKERAAEQANRAPIDPEVRRAKLLEIAALLETADGSAGRAS